MPKNARKLSPNFPAGKFTSGDYIDLGFLKIFKFTTAITSGVTTVPAAAAVGDLAITTNATGDESIFKNIGGVWTAV
ncbi:MAG: hypothetical protein ACK4S4_15795 [Pyrinomonadaceae bacterium]